MNLRDFIVPHSAHFSNWFSLFAAALLLPLRRTFGFFLPSHFIDSLGRSSCHHDDDDEIDELVRVSRIFIIEFLANFLLFFVCCSGFLVAKKIYIILKIPAGTGWNDGNKLSTFIHVYVDNFRGFLLLLFFLCCVISHSFSSSACRSSFFFISTRVNSIVTELSRSRCSACDIEFSPSHLNFSSSREYIAMTDELSQFSKLSSDTCVMCVALSCTRKTRWTPPLQLRQTKLNFNYLNVNVISELHTWN